MGEKLSKLFRKIYDKKEVKILMLGFSGSGKTSRLSNNSSLSLSAFCKLVYDFPCTTIPTIGFNVEHLVHNDVKFRIWDIGDTSMARSFWWHYYPGTQGLIFVIDSQDWDENCIAKWELHAILKNKEMKDCVLLVFANKQDLPDVMSPEKVAEKLELHKLQDRVWRVLPSCAKSGEGLLEGLTWLSQNTTPR